MSNAKKYISTGIILGLIAGISAGLIALTNKVTQDRIVKNEQNKINAGIQDIFGEHASIKDENSLENHEYSTYSYEIIGESSEKLGYAIKCEGSNMYGKISLLAGFDETSHAFMSVYLIKNEQTYASTLVDNYVTPLNSSEKNVEDVNCGATYGAKLIRDMINEATSVVSEFWVEK